MLSRFIHSRRITQCAASSISTLTAKKGIGIARSSKPLVSAQQWVSRSVPRRLNSTQNAAASAASENAASIAPFPIRVLLVGTTVGLATPIFALGGIVRLWFSYLPQTTLGNVVKYVSMVGFGGGIVKILSDYVIPFLRNHSEFVLPFAITNGVVSAIWYTIGEAVYGLEAIAGGITVAEASSILGTSSFWSFLRAFPIAGPAIGALTAVTAPIFWPTAFDYCWSPDMHDLLLHEDPTWISTLYEWIALPVGVPIGALAGMSIHLMLRPLIMGTPKTNWTITALPALMAISTAALAYFSIFRTEDFEYFWISRLDPKTGAVVSLNCRTGEVIADNGAKGESARLKRDYSTFVKYAKNPLSIFDSDDIYTASSTSKADMLETRLREGYHLDKLSRASVHKINDGLQLYQIVDALVVFQNLRHGLESAGDDDNLKAEAAAKLAKFESFVKDTLGVTDLKGLFHDLELAIIAKRRFDREGNKDNAYVVTEAFKKILKHAPTDNGMRLPMLCHNIDHYENELKDVLGYTVTEEQEQVILTKFETEQKVERVQMFVLTGAAVAAAAAMLSFMFSR